MSVSVRHTLLSLQKREKWYEDLRPGVGGSDFNPLAASANFCAFVDQHGHGAVVLPLSSVSKARQHPLPSVRVGAEVRGLEWDPFCASNLATAGTNGSVKLWSIPAGGLQSDLTSPIVTMDTAMDNGGGIPSIHAVPKGIAFHPCAPGLIAVRGLRKVSLFDLTRPQTPCFTLGGDQIFQGDTYDMRWSFSGDVLLTTDKARTLKLSDPRVGRVVAQGNEIHGPGTSRVMWCDNSVYMLTTGISKLSREREFAVWDARSLASPVCRTRVGGTSSGFLMPQMLYGLDLLTLCGRGDANVRLYSFDYASGKVTAISNTAVGGVARAYAFVPRESCEFMSCEVTRLLKLCDDSIQPVSVIVPRRDRMRFHKELFPPAPGGCPSLTTPDWLSGINIPPYLQAFRPTSAEPQHSQQSSTGQTSPATEAAAINSVPIESVPAAEEPGAGQSSVPAVIDDKACPNREDATDGPYEQRNRNAPSQGVTADIQDEGVALSDEGESSSGLQASAKPETTAVQTSTSGAVDNEIEKTSLHRATSTGSDENWRHGTHKRKLRHVFAAGTKGTKPVFNLSPLLTSLDGPIIAASASFWAVPWLGGGGPVYVSPMEASGKVEPDCCFVNGHRAPVLCIAFSPFRPALMATGSEDSTVKLWEVPKGGLTDRSMGAEDAVMNLTFNSTAVKHVEFHPRADNVVMTTNADHSVQLCDVAGGGDTAALVVNVHSNTINSACFNGDGDLIATTSRDGNVRIIDPRAGSVVAEGKGHEGRKAQKAAWCFGATRREALATTGCAAAGHRQLCLWDPRDLSKPYVTKTVDSSNGLLIPMYCEAAGMIILAGRGGCGMKVYELTGADDNNAGEDIKHGFPNLHSCNEFKANGDPLSGAALLPPSSIDVTAVEVARVLRATPSAVEPVSFTAPRATDLKEYFQDDIYCPVRKSEPCLSSSEWFNGREVETVDGPIHVSLCPPGVKPLSERPAPVETSVPKAVVFRQQMEQRQKEEEDATNMMQKMARLANQNAAYNPNKSVGVVMGVDQATIEDSGSEGDWSD